LTDQRKAPCLFSFPDERGTNGKEAPFECFFTLITTPFKKNFKRYVVLGGVYSFGGIYNLGRIFDAEQVCDLLELFNFSEDILCLAR